ncbi:MAG: DNA mismatch repair endonuclease MutL [Ignavibacteriae bacterium]|nr:DNA mismatch repair endonuclease MutL [Ignavibacteriota bacterium]
MTQTIHILPKTLADKIAAGEVVQRPASAVKELIENSIDAQATSITVVVKDGGKTLIQVIDDGIGMSHEDAVLAFERHSTSKIATYEDLEQIRTLGFRGEALASIAAVSQVEMKTRQASDQIGTKIRIEGGVTLEETAEATQAGTIITVRNLFYNTPGRRNFLKTNNTEFRHIYDVVQRIALSHPHLAMTFISDDEAILTLYPTTSSERIKDIFGEHLSQYLFFFERQSELASISGFLGKPDFVKKTRIEQYLFLNNRYIVNRSMNHAVYQAYEHLLEKGSFPFFVLFLNVDPRKVDVNVHPSKMEVKFGDESSIYRFILSSIRKALSEQDLIPLAGIKADGSLVEMQKLAFTLRPGISGQRVVNWQELFKQDAQSDTTTVSKSSTHREISIPIPETAKNIPSPTQLETSTTSQIPTQEPQTKDLPSVWQIHNKYLLAAIEGGIVVIDQHAAHERVLYERALSRFNDKHSKSQQLLFPLTIEMTSGDVTLIQQLLPHLETLGFNLKVFGKTTVIVDGVPVDVKPGDEKTILQDVLDLYKEDEHNLELEPREKLAKSFSCKAAIKAGDPLNHAEMRSLLDQLFATEIPYVCPHGRPVIIKLSLAELDKRFGRTS